MNWLDASPKRRNLRGHIRDIPDRCRSVAAAVQHEIGRLDAFLCSHVCETDDTATGVSSSFRRKGLAMRAK